MVGKRHASGEIAAKLAQANELVAKGKTQREISKVLGVSIMTYHRWKKMSGHASSGEGAERANSELQPHTSSAIDSVSNQPCAVIGRPSGPSIGAASTSSSPFISRP